VISDPCWDLSSSAFSSGSAFKHLAKMREDAPCVRLPFQGVQPAWNLVRHGDVLNALAQPLIYSSQAGGTTLQDQSPQQSAENSSLLHIDPPNHGRVRRQFSSAFTSRSLEGIRPVIAGIAEELVTGARSQSHVDAVHDLGARVVSYSLAEALGIPRDLRDYFMRLSALMLADTPPDIAAIDYASLRLPVGFSRRLSGSPSARMIEVLRHLRSTSACIDLRAPESETGQRELEDLLVVLATAGTGMTQNCVVTGLTLFARNWPDVRRRRCELTEALPMVVEEVIRLACPLRHVRRTLIADRDVHGCTLRAGDKVLLWLVSANTDERVFSQGEVFDPVRAPNPHLSFGRGGPHYCLGAELARIEVDAVLRTILSDVQDLELLQEPTLLASNFVRETSQALVRMR
jgi:cytochrome P450